MANVREKMRLSVWQSIIETIDFMRLFYRSPNRPLSHFPQCLATLPLPTDGSRSTQFRETVCSLGIFKLRIQILEHCTNSSRYIEWSSIVGWMEGGGRRVYQDYAQLSLD